MAGSVPTFIKSLEFQKVKLKSGVTGWICDILKPGVAYLLEVWQPEEEGEEYRQDLVLHTDIESLLIEVEVPFDLAVPMPTGEFEEQQEAIRRQHQREQQAYKQQYQAAVA
ncbi:MAG: hypothetical protein LBM98_02825 [Oscillospiraceae bacterium]|jgi:hypothetical protein|nr:hypothetical protein [Oscillospiraceae bacterium]